MDELKKQLESLLSQQKAYHAKAEEQQKATGTVQEDLKKQIDALQKQADALDAKIAERAALDPKANKSLDDYLKEQESVDRLMKDKSGKASIHLDAKQFRDIFERKTTISSSAVGQATSGILQIDRIPGITLEARQQLMVRDLLSARPTTYQVVDFVKVNAPMAIASPVVEANTKPENAVTFVSHSEKVRLIATWIPASRQILDDFTELAGFLRTSLPYYVNLEEELQLLSGDSTGENLNGLITQAQAFNTGLLHNSQGWNKIDLVGRAIQQITAAKELLPTFVVLHPTDWWEMRLTKDNYGRYILGDPQTSVDLTLFGLKVVPTTSIANGTFLVGSGNPEASEIRDRMEMQIDISTEHSTFFTQNLVAIRAEKRMALVVKRVNSYVTGTFTTSPA